MIPPKRLDELIQSYVLGILTESESEELQRHLEQDDAKESRRKLRLALKADAYLEEAASELGGEPATEPREAIGRQSAFAKRTFWTALGIAASLAAVITLSNNRSPRDTDEPRVAKPLHVATILRIEGKGQTQQLPSLSRGDELMPGDQLTMSEGLVELVFRDSGVHAIATAPLSLTARSPKHVFLGRGDVKLHVPPQGIGFVVETSERKITDLGTRFVVTAREKESQVFVLEGQVDVGRKNGGAGHLMSEGEVAVFGQKGQQQQLLKKAVGMTELTLLPLESDPTVRQTKSLPGMIFGLNEKELPDEPLKKDLMGQRLGPLIQSGFRDRNCIQGLITGEPLRFAGVAGAYQSFAERNGFDPEVVSRAGWLTWYSGKVMPPGAGRYRFWGYGDNSLLVAIDGEPVFDGSRFDSAFRESVHVPRQDHPAWPCLNAMAGFASGPWIEIEDGPVQFDLLFGEKHGNLTFGLLLVEREGETYEKTQWGQPKWPLFLTEPPGPTQQDELDELLAHMEEELLGSFSVSTDAIWNATESNFAEAMGSP